MLLIRLYTVLKQKVHNIFFIQQHLLTVKMYNWIYILNRYENMLISLYYPAYSYLIYSIFKYSIFNLDSEKSH